MSHSGGSLHENTLAGGGQGIRSPEQVVLDLPIAGPTSRMLAYGIDVVLLLAALAALAFLLANPALLLRSAALSAAEGWVEELRDPQRMLDAVREMLVFALSVVLLLQVAAETVYFVLFETLANGRSPGKMVVGLRVVSESGRAIGFPQALARNLLRFIDALPLGYVVGLSSALLSPHRQRLGDIAAGTIVVRLDRPPSAAVVDDTARSGDEAFVFDWRQSLRIGAPEVRLARETLRRTAETEHEDGSEDPMGILAASVAALAARLGHGAVAPRQRAAFLRAVLRAARKQRGG